jgi:general secretion pathway protein G
MTNQTARRNPRLTSTRSVESRLRTESSTGFTLIELLLVLVILSILAAVVVPRFTGGTDKARKARAATDIAAIDGAVDRFELDMGRPPTNEEGLAILAQQQAPPGAKEWSGPYLKQVPTDPWGNPYLYRSPGQYNTKGVDIASMGPNGQEGGNDDITNWTQQ